MSELPPLPDDAKQVLPFILRAQEMISRDPAIAYWCKMHAARVALQCASDIPNLRPWLLQLMDHLELEKNRLATNEYISNPTIAFSHLENFALKIFAAADREDRAGKASLRTAKTFLAASNYFDVLSVFNDTGDLDLDIKEKAKYAKWKATDIVKALKSGQIPLPGPSTMEEDSNMEINNRNHQIESQFPLPPPSSNYSPSSLPNQSTWSTPPLDSNIIPSNSISISSTYPNTTNSSIPSATSPLSQLPTVNTFSPHSSSSVPSPLVTTGNLPDPRVLAQAQKLARFAISALEYDDISTAIDNLTKALNIITPLDPRHHSLSHSHS